MPKISNLRFANIHYGKPARNIDDITFDLYKGNHSLIIGTNGIGKSVLIQETLAPMMEKRKQRTICEGKDFIDLLSKKNKTPQCVVIEFLLDEPNEKYISLVFLAKRNENLKKQELENNKKVEDSSTERIFFIHPYSRNEFNINEIQIKDDENNQYFGMELMCEKLENLLKKKNMNYKAYRNLIDNPNERNAFFQKLEQKYGIYKNDWQIIMHSINKEEGGLAKILSDSKYKSPTAKKAAFLENNVFNVIDQKVSNSDKYSDETFENIKEACIELVEASRDNKIYLEKERSMKQIYAQFQNEKSNKIVDDLVKEQKSFKKHQSELLQNKIDLENAEKYLNKEIQDKSEEVNLLEQSELEIQKYYLNSEYQSLINTKTMTIENHQKYVMLKKEMSDCIEQKQEEISKLKIGNFKKEIGDLYEQYGETQALIEKQENNNNQAKQIYEIGSYLNHYFENEINQTNKKINNNIEKTEHLKQTKIHSEKKSEKIEQIFSDLTKESGILKERFSNLVAQENVFLNSDYVKNLRIELNKNMFGEYQLNKDKKNPIQQNIDFYISEKDGIEKKMFELSNEKNIHLNKKESLEKKLLDIRSFLVQQESNKKIVENNYTINVINPKQQCIELINTYLDISNTISDKKIDELKSETQFTLETLIKKKQNILTTLQNKKEEKINRKNILENPSIASTKNNVVHNVLSFLKEEGYFVEYGWNWLETQSSSEAEKAITLNPLLPHSIIALNKDDLESIKKTLITMAKEKVIHTNFDFSVILTTFDSIKSNDQSQCYPENSVFFQQFGDTCFYTAVDNLLLNKEERLNEIKELENELEKIDIQIHELEEEIEYTQNDKYALQKNPYTFEQDILHLKEIQKVDYEIEKNNNLLKETISEKEKIELKLNEIETVILCENEKELKMNDLLEKLHQYNFIYNDILQTKNDMQQNEIELCNAKQEISSIKEKMQNIQKETSELKHDLQINTQNLENLKEKHNTYLKYMSVDETILKSFENESVNSLMKKYEILSQKQSSCTKTINELNEKLKILSKSISDLKEKIDSEIVLCPRKIEHNSIMPLKTPGSIITRLEKELESIKLQHFEIASVEQKLAMEIDACEKNILIQKEKIINEGFPILEREDIISYEEGYPKKLQKVKKTVNELKRQTDKYREIKVNLSNFLLAINHQLQDCSSINMYVSNSISIEHILDNEKRSILFNELNKKLSIYKNELEKIHNSEKMVKSFITELIHYCDELKGIDQIKAIFVEFDTIFEQNKKSLNYDNFKEYYLQVSDIIDDAIKANDHSLDTYKAKFEKCLNSLFTYFKIEYQQMQEIDKMSKVQIFENVKKTKLFRINLDKFENKKDEYKLKLRIFLTKLIEEALTADDDLHKFKSSITPLNIFKALQPFENINVQVAKISGGYEEIHMQTFEEALKFSGGEATFVCCEILFPILYYAHNDAFFDKHHSSVLIMDNPIAQTSSMELLTSILKLANAMNIQLVCFTHEANDDQINDLFPVMIKLHSISINNKLKDEMYVYAEANPINNDALEVQKEIYNMNFTRIQQEQLF